MKKFFLIPVFFAAAVLSVSCDKDDNNQSISDADLLTASAVSDYATESDFQAAMESANDNGSLRQGDAATSLSSVAPCADVTFSGTTFPLTITIDFGTGCTNNGITRSGILTIALTGPLMQAGSEMTIQRNNYYVNGYHIEGSVYYVNQTTDSNIPEWTRTITNGHITNPAGAVFVHSGTRTVRQIEGVATPLILADNVFEITAGSHTVTGPSGNSLTATIVTPLIKKHSCPYISQGVLHLNGTYLDGDLDYGNNDCDDLAVYTHSDGQSYTIHL
ncbi:MAG: hypothetical protein EOO51_07090 [Flavobacterium sp.]|nr:MAG: hypothetical protein EOO51_07090 [Flavobacterium sp.]